MAILGQWSSNGLVNLPPPSEAPEKQVYSGVNPVK